MNILSKQVGIENNFWEEAASDLMKSRPPVMLPHYRIVNDSVYTVRGRKINNLSTQEVEVLKKCVNNKCFFKEDVASLFMKRLITFVPLKKKREKTVKRVLIISPHIDDAALSIGAYISCLASEGFHIDVFNIYSKQSYQTGIRVPDNRIENFSIIEEKIASRCLGYRFINAGMIGASNRTNLLLSEIISKENTITNVSAANDNEIEIVADAIESIFLQGNYSSAFCPMAIGQHIDHMIVYSAIKRLIKKDIFVDCSIFFYEDQPYVAAGMTCNPISHEVGEVIKETCDVTKNVFIKLSALQAYCTRLRVEQINSCFTYAINQDIAGRFCENIWKLVASV